MLGKHGRERAWDNVPKRYKTWAGSQRELWTDTTFLTGRDKVRQEALAAA